jgi:uncharacterized repeat protein (TIGR03803 family)
MKRPSYLKTLCLMILLLTRTAPSQVFTTLLNFDGTNGAVPEYSTLIQGPDGNFYGTTYGGGYLNCNVSATGCGTVFRITPTGALTTIHMFCKVAGCPDGALPYSGLALGTNGKLYGTTPGTIFEITPDGAFETLHVFNGQDGEYAYGTLIQAADGNFFGTTYSGGTGNLGTIFKMTPSGVLTTLYDFCPVPQNCTSSAQPVAGLIQGSDGNFYGTTEWGGTTGNGTVFQLTPNGVLTTLYSFCSESRCEDGARPYAPLVEASNGIFYGTTEWQGRGGGGTVFSISRAGAFKVVYQLCKTGCPYFPYAALIQATDGNLYGMSSQGGLGDPSYGATFEIVPSGIVTTVQNFDGNNGSFPLAGLLQATNGSFYGMTSYGGADNDGTVFSLSTGLGPFVAFVGRTGKIGQAAQIVGQGFTAALGVSFNGAPASFTVESDTFLKATVPAGATTGYVTVTTPSGTLTSNVPFHVIP